MISFFIMVSSDKVDTLAVSGLSSFCHVSYFVLSFNEALLLYNLLDFM